MKVNRLWKVYALSKFFIISILTFPFLTGCKLNNLSTVSYPTELDVPYSFENPPCRSFSEAEKQKQIEDGNRIIQEIIKAEKSGKDSYTIPKGDYRFLQTPRKKSLAAFYLEGIKRGDDRPFSILAKNVTFWTPPNANGNGNSIYLNECENIRIVGVTVDSDTPNDIEGKLIAVDTENNRIEIELLPGTITDETKIRKKWAEKRIIPFKANGRSISELYSVDGTWGPGFNFVNKVEPANKPGRYWLTFRQRGLVDVIDDPKWEAVYGEQGTWKIGDGISILYGTGGAFNLHNCKHIVMKDLTSHIAKFAIWESGGFGAHKWINVKLIRRPGTNQLLGGDGTMFEAMKNGSTYDGLVIGGTTDDAINLHGYMGFILGSNNYNHIITVNRRPELFLPGDRLEFYNINTGKYLGNAITKTVDGNEIAIDREIPAAKDSIIVRYPDYECANWTIKNSTFYGPYQRILIQTGPGIFENNICRDLGGPLSLDNNFAGYEGGKLYDVTIRNNLFIDCGTSPNLNTVDLQFWAKTSKPITNKNIVITNNIFLNSGSNAIKASETDGLKIEGNIFINPLRATALLQPSKLLAKQAVVVSNCKNVDVSDNILFQKQKIADAGGIIDATLKNGNTSLIQSENQSFIDAKNLIQQYVYKLFEDDHKTLDATGMYRNIRRKSKEFIRSLAK